MTELATMAPRILIVDDDADARRLLDRHLTVAGYQVLAVESAAEALVILHNEGPEILIADWMMPGMSGVELARTIRGSESIGFVYIIILTAHTGTSRIVEAFEAGVDDFLSKPLNCDELLARLNAAARILKLERDLARERRAVHKTNAELAILNTKLERVATTDELTQLTNRREGIRRMKEQWAGCARRNEPFSCAMMDIDHFKSFNDTYGHDVGDAVLRQTAGLLRKIARAGETIFRLGGEEFLLICPSCGAEMVEAAGERLRAAVESNVVRHCGLELSITISVGAAERTEKEATPDDLLKSADVAMYRAKTEGRNRVCLAGKSPVPVGS